jgi:hypothetical protein
MHGFVNLTKAAELLTAAGYSIDRSALSRYVYRYADAVRLAELVHASASTSSTEPPL